MEIRITRTPPAPWMDGFDVGRFHVGRVYVVDDRLARYLIVAGYAEAATRFTPANPLTDERAES